MIVRVVVNSGVLLRQWGLVENYSGRLLVPNRLIITVI